MNWFYKLVAFIMTFFIHFPVGEIATYTTSYNDASLVFTVLADIHIEGNNEERFKSFGKALADISSAERNDALVFLGDNTMNGQVVELSAFFELLKEHNQTGNTLLALGNHDLCPSDYNTGDYEDLRDRFFQYKNEYIKAQYDDKVYYSYEINGYKFIILGSESDAGVGSDISNTQLNWLENEIRNANDNPIFIFNHNPLNHTWEDVWSEGHIGDNSEKLHSLLKNYDKQIIFFSGHLHMGLYNNQVSYINEENITYISVPSFGSDNDVGDAPNQDKGMGMRVEIYEDKIIIRIRDFVNHEWKNIEYKVDISN